MSDRNDQLSIMVTEAQADTIKALFGHSRWELTKLGTNDVELEITVNKATEERLMWFCRGMFVMARLFVCLHPSCQLVRVHYNASHPAALDVHELGPQSDGLQKRLLIISSFY